MTKKYKDKEIRGIPLRDIVQASVAYGKEKGKAEAYKKVIEYLMEEKQNE